VCHRKTQDRGKVLSELKFILYVMPTVSQGDADKREAKGTTQRSGTDSPADSRHWERNLGLCDEVTALEHPTAAAGGKHRQG